MKGFKRCDNGHFYKDTMDVCPYCPKNESAAPAQNTVNLDKTQISGGMDNLHESADSQKTQVFGSSNAPSDKTQVFGGGQQQTVAPQKRDLNKTFIQGMDFDAESKDSNNSMAGRATRKITGWIVSFTIDPMGVDFRIYEGNNTIGRDPGNSITITNDPAISGKHVTILYKKGKFYIKDEMAANGTFLNDQELEIGKPYELNDGDVIRLANTSFKFKSAE
ncbi:MAG: hypothetical protein Fur0041_00300 [Bacteroidia bacterium]